MKEETILYDAGSVRFCVLNETASFIWERLDAPRSLNDLVDDLIGQFGDVDRSTAEHDLQAVLHELVGLSFVSSAPSDNGARSLDAAPVGAALPAGYRTPRARVMDESEVLAAFQVTSAGMTWWVM